MAIQLGILIFDDVEVLDFCGPIEVFGAANDVTNPDPFNIHIIAEEMRIINARKNLNVMPTHSIDNCPKLDILLVPGGEGTRPILKRNRLLQWINNQYASLDYLLSVCTGSIVLGKAGLLNNIEATTHHTCFDELKNVSPSTKVITNQRYVESGNIVTSAGISAGMDMSLFMVEKLLGKEITQEAIREMEYNGYDQ